MNILGRSSLKIKNGLPYFGIPAISQLGWIRHAFLTRKGGISPPPYDTLNLSVNNGDRPEHVSRNKNRIAKAFEFELNRLALLDQIHQDRILRIAKPSLSLRSPLEYDAQMTNASNILLGILTADCIPIFVADRRKKVIAAIHAGRQGTALCITPKVLKKMKQEFGCLSQDLLVVLGPSIRSCCYEIDEKAYAPEWEPFSIPTGVGKWKVDLARINIAQIEKEGVREEQIFWIDLCTGCHQDLFFSNRKEGKTGRQLSFIGIKEK
ncbi:MAG: peptidoglycan editing factor PgeF [Thermodesulfobacteriota bacterium]